MRPAHKNGERKMPRPTRPYKTKRITLTVASARENDVRVFNEKVLKEEHLKALKKELKK